MQLTTLARCDASSVIAIQKCRAINRLEGRVVHVIDNELRVPIKLAAQCVNDGPWDVVSLQHEFGLYPGDWGDEILTFVNACHKPLVTTFHTLPTEPAAKPYGLIRMLAQRSDAVIVMTEMASKLLQSTYRVAGTAVHVIPHGVPAVPLSVKRYQEFGWTYRA